MAGGSKPTRYTPSARVARARIAHWQQRLELALAAATPRQLREAGKRERLARIASRDGGEAQQ